jgi:hypothetical protein
MKEVDDTGETYSEEDWYASSMPQGMKDQLNIQVSP